MAVHIANFNTILILLAALSSSMRQIDRDSSRFRFTRKILVGIVLVAVV